MAQSNRKRRRFKNYGIKPGASPGNIDLHQGSDSTMRVIAYGPTEIKELTISSPADAKKLEADYEVIWIDIIGIGNVELLKDFAKTFHIHALSLEDVVNVHHRAKLEKFDKYDYYVTRMVSRTDEIQSEQLSIFHADKYVITFQQFEGDCLGPLRDRIRGNLGFVRKSRSDYLVYALIDTVIDHYFPIIDWLGERLDVMDSQLMDNGQGFSAADLHYIRNQLLDLGRWLRPNREMINQLLRDESSNMSPTTQIFMRDCYDNIIQLNEAIETYREVCSELRAYHLSALSNRTNDVMKTLTIVSTIFIPLSFVAGLYGMNFDTMPELHWQFGYFAVLGFMVAIAFGFLAWFHRRGWFTG